MQFDRILHLVSDDPSATIVLVTSWKGFVVVAGTQLQEIIPVISPCKITIPLGRNRSTRGWDMVEKSLVASGHVPNGDVYFLAFQRPQGTQHGAFIVPRAVTPSFEVEGRARPRAVR